jgi:hypothetical protein
MVSINVFHILKKKRMTFRKHATWQHNFPNIAKTLNWRAISEVPKLSEHTTYTILVFAGVTEEKPISN